MNPSIVLVHGAWHGAWVWEPVAKRLRARGLSVHAPEFSNDTRDVDLSHHLRHLLEAIDRVNGDLVLVGHSYGGMLVTGAAAARPTRVVRRVYVDALVPADGDSVATLAGPKMTEAAIANAHGSGDGWRVSPDFFPPSKFVDWQGSRLTEFQSRLTAQSLRTFLEPISLEATPPGHSDYVLCTSDPLGVFDPIAAARRRLPNWSVYELPTRHDAMLTMPDVVAAIVANGCDS